MWLLELLQEKLLSDLLKQDAARGELERLAVEVADKKCDPYSAVESVLKHASNNAKGV